MNRPKVVVLNSASVDGKIAVSSELPPLCGDERWQAIEGTDRFNVFEWQSSVPVSFLSYAWSGEFE